MSETDKVDFRKETLVNTKRRLFKVLDYWVLFAYVVLVSVGALFADYLIVLALEKTFAPSISKYPIVAQAFDWFQIGSAFLVLIGAGVHAIFSMMSQVKFEYRTTFKDESNA